MNGRRVAIYARVSTDGQTHSPTGHRHHDTSRHLKRKIRMVKTFIPFHIRQQILRHGKTAMLLPNISVIP